MSNILALFGVGAGISITVLILVVWSIFWKGWALWIAARDGEKWWFIAMIILNTAGILEIVYIFAVKKMRFNFDTKKFEKNITVEPIKETEATSSTSESNSQNN